MFNSPRFFVLPCVALLAGAVACGGGGGNGAPTAPTPTPPSAPAYNPDVPTAGLDVSERRLLDGAGNPGAMRVQLQSVFPGLGHQVPAGAPEVQVQFNAPRVCMDAITIPGAPQVSPYIAEMRFTFVTSEDGVRPTPPFQSSFFDGAGTRPYRVANGECVSVKRVLESLGGTPGAQFIIFARPTRFLMLAATYGSNLPPDRVFNWPSDACPSYQAIASGQWNTSQGTPNCTLRVVWSLDYRW